MRYEKIGTEIDSLEGIWGLKISRQNWNSSFFESHVPTFPCPRCVHGRVQIDKSTLKSVEPTYSELDRKHPDWEPDWSSRRFSLRLRCNESNCGEIVIVSGDKAFSEYEDKDFGHQWHDTLIPKSMFPAPPIIRFPESTPRKIVQTIKTSFALFWVDLGSSANSLRMSLEFLLDHLDVPRTWENKKGKQIERNLNARIELFEKSNPAFGRSFHALRIVGNLGSHEASMDRDTILDAFEIYEDALNEIIGSQKDYIESLKEKIITNKSQY